MTLHAIAIAATGDRKRNVQKDLPESRNDCSTDQHPAKNTGVQMLKVGYWEGGRVIPHETQYTYLHARAGKRCLFEIQSGKNHMPRGAGILP